MPATDPLYDTLQTRTLRTFTVLHHLRQDWGGALILSCGLGPQGAALSIAANIAGAVCLSIEESPTVAHQALRSGSCDFVVNTLDEALRAMKNEVRKHLPLSVGLQANLLETLQELLDRGVAPQLFTDLSHLEARAFARSFKSNGAIIMDFDRTNPEAIDADALLETTLAQSHWHLESFPQPTPSALRAFDARALNLIAPEDTLRSKWLHAAPKILPRESPLCRTLWLTRHERDHLIHDNQHLATNT